MRMIWAWWRGVGVTVLIECTRGIRSTEPMIAIRKLSNRAWRTFLERVHRYDCLSACSLMCPAVFYFVIFSRRDWPPPPALRARGGGQHFEARIDRGNSTFFENGINRANLRFLTYIVYIDTLMSKCDRSVLKTFVV